MVQRYNLSRILGFLIAAACTCAILGLAAQVAPAKQGNIPGESGVILLDVAKQGQEGELPPVVFDHSRHTQGEENTAASCASCHDGSDAKSGYSFKGTDGKTGKALEEAFHAGCISCHENLSAKGRATGPLQAECRSCHQASSVPAKDKDARADGGLDASLHARHIASPLIVAVGRDENCAACHHPVDKPVSPGVKADSCRSCHLARENAVDTGRPAFADVAHAKCISCHQSLASSGVNAPVTCASCHDAAAKAGYKQVSPVPRLNAGQPDSVILGTPPSPKDSSLPTPPASLEGSLPDPNLDAATRPQPSQLPVVFDHKRHEAASNGCTSCHHNTLQKCSSCHTVSGSAKGGNVPLATAMHLPNSDLSCVGCHESRKTAQAECAGCHAIMRKGKATETNCASCHAPLPTRENAAKAPDLASVIAAAPDKVTIASLADEYEPAVFEHRRHVEKLAEGIMKVSPGMMRFHAEPYALCASCHHNSPPSATPPPCASCHSKGTNTPKTASAKGLPDLKVAYHQQCMGCHTNMAITKPANTDCATCHAERAPSR